MHLLTRSLRSPEGGTQFFPHPTVSNLEEGRKTVTFETSSRRNTRPSSPTAVSEIVANDADTGKFNTK